MRWGMVIDLKRCIGCYGCQLACMAEHGTPPGVFFARVLKQEDGQYPTVRQLSLPVLCNHCEDAPCVAACPNASSALFTGAKIAHLGILPQGKPERDLRALRMVAQMNTEAFGSCTNIGECTAACPKEIQLEVIAVMNRDYLRASVNRRDYLVTTISPFTEWSTGGKVDSAGVRD